MTKKQHKLLANESHTWGREVWVDTKLEKLLWQASHLSGSQATYKTQAYVVSTPIPPWMANGKENYGMVQTVQRRRFSKEIAEELIAEKGEFAYLYALEQAETTRDTSLWKDVLTWLDELTGEKK